ncbi:MAG TPA: TolC family protein, partial [Alphaproteobacteria bacterium]
EEVFDSRRRLRDAGRETAINVLDAQSEVFNARLNYLAATYDAQLAVFRVLGAMGLLGPGDLGL